MGKTINVSKKFIAIPKKFDWPEDLDGGLFDVVDNITIEFNACEWCYYVYKNVTRTEGNEKDLTLYYRFPLEEYYVFVDGVLVNKEENKVLWREDEALKAQMNGHWISTGRYTLICSVCGNYSLYNGLGRAIDSTYCPHCGASMITYKEAVNDDNET